MTLPAGKIRKSHTERRGKTLGLPAASELMWNCSPPLLLLLEMV